MVTRGEGPLGLDPTTCHRPSVIIIVTDVALYPPELYQAGIRVVTAATRLVPSACVDARIKSLNYLKNVLARLEAHEAGAAEALMLNGGTIRLSSRPGAGAEAELRLPIAR